MALTDAMKRTLWIPAAFTALGLFLSAPEALADGCEDAAEAPDWDAAVTYSARHVNGALIVDFEVAPCFHAYGPKTKLGKPLKVSLRSSSGFEAAGPARYPAGVKEVGPFGPRRVIRGAGRIRLPVRRRDAEAKQVKATLHYHACTENACGPPRRVELVASTE